jgi:hypothetical protein
MSVQPAEAIRSETKRNQRVRFGRRTSLIGAAGESSGFTIAVLSTAWTRFHFVRNARAGRRATPPATVWASARILSAV